VDAKLDFRALNPEFIALRDISPDIFEDELIEQKERVIEAKDKVLNSVEEVAKCEKKEEEEEEEKATNIIFRQ
jgi:hypothetical protein